MNRLRGNGRKAKGQPLKLRGDGVQVTVSDPAIEGLQAFAERLVAALKRLAKDGDAIESLPTRLKAL